MPAFRVLLLAGLVGTALQLPGAGAAAPTPEAHHLIPFAAGTVDPAADWTAQDPDGRDLVLVQWTDFGQRGIVQSIAATGAVLVQPLAPVSYIVHADAEQTAALRQVDGVRFAGVLPASVRLAPSVTATTTRLRVTVVGADAVDGLAGLSVWDRAFSQADGAIVEVPGDARLAGALAALPRVYSVADAGGPAQLRDERTVQVVASGSAAPPTPDYETFLQRIGADGTGVVVAQVDSGVDFTHPELSDRVAACIDYSLVPAGGLCNARNTDGNGHGTHVLGHVMGTGSTGLADAGGFRYGQGVAPGAKAVVQNAISRATAGSSPFARGYRPVYRDAAQRGAVVSQNSWGPSGTPKGYDAVTREFDSIVRDADSDVAGDQSLGLVFSIMNGGGKTSTQGSPDEAKNIIGVGGTGGRNSLIQPSAPTVDDLCTCTAHGPALDGRLLPTIVAPAQNVMSPRAAQGTSCGSAGTGDSTPSPLHAPCTGTSFASPHVSGGYALFVDWYRQRFDGATPSPALLKAAFVNGADDLAGRKDANGRVMSAIPNNQQGWGRLNLGNVFDGWTGGAVHVDQSVVLDATGDGHALLVEPVDPSRPMKATLAWTDALGPGLGGKTPAWINDLDLSVTAPDGRVYLGNVFEQGTSVGGGGADRMNNLENVFLHAPAAGTYSVSIEAANLIGDGMPNRVGLTDQDFALVITNARTVSP